MIIVIGASSFIGVHTVDYLLSQGCEVVVTGRNNKFKSHYDTLGVQYVNLDLRNKSDFENLPKKGVEGVILLGGLLPANTAVDLDTDENAADYFEINTIGTINVLEYCRKNGIKKVISTCSYADVINSWNAEHPLTEDEPRSYRYEGDHAVYVFSKNAANDMLLYYNAQHGMSNAIFRLPPVYGAGPHGFYHVNGVLMKSAIQKFMDKARAGEDILVFEGDEKFIRDFAYVKDVARAFYLAIKSGNAKGLYNMTSGVGVSMKDQAEIIAEVFCEGKKSNLVKVEKSNGNPRSFLFSMEKAKKDFGFEPEFSSFRKMMTDYKKDIDNGLYKDLFNY